MPAAVLCLLPVLACAAETSVAPPAIGTVRDCEGRIRQVFGVPGAFVLGSAGAAQSSATPPAPEGARLEGRTLVLRQADGSERRVPLGAAAGRLQRMAPGWLAALPFAIKLTADSATVYRLPMQVCREAGR
jgi:hypothetical protein